MDTAHECEEFTDKELEQINFCQLYLNVVTISDICDTTGSYIQLAANSGTRSQLLSKSKWIGLVQANPDYHSWRIWHCLLCQFSIPNRQLLELLEPWKQDPFNLDRIWKSYRHKQGNWHYIQQKTDNNLWLILQRDGNKWIKTGFLRHVLWTDLFPCKLDDLFTDSLIQIPPPAPSPDIAGTFHEFLDQQPDNIRHFLAHVELFKSPFQTAQACSLEPHMILATDGASLPKKIAYGWILAHPRTGHLAKGSEPAYGQSTLHRVEGHGVHAGVHFLQLLQEFTQCTDQFKIKLFCDNQGVFDSANCHQQYVKPFPNQALNANWDQLETMHHIATDCSFHINFAHVKGHQDEQTQNLNFEATLNVKADFLASQQIYQDITARLIAPLTKTAQCHLQIQS